MPDTQAAALKAHPWLDAELHLLPKQWCEPGYKLPDSEAYIRNKIYHHPEGPLALSRAHESALFDEMKRSGIWGGALTGLPWMDPGRCRDNDRAVAETVRHGGEGFYGFGLLPHPEHCDAVAEVHRIAAMPEMVGVKLIPSWFGLKLDGGELAPALAEIARLGLVLMVHTDHPYLPPAQYDPPSSLLAAAQCHPDLKILAPHLGGLLALYNLHEPLRDVLKNMLFVTSVPTTMPMIRWALEAVGPERLAFGTDFPFNPSHDMLSLRETFEGLGFDETTTRLIAHDNLTRFLGGAP